MPSRTVVKPEDALLNQVVMLKKQLRQQAAPTGTQNNLTTEKVLQAIEDLQTVQAEQADIIAQLNTAVGTLAETVAYLESLTVSTAVGSTSQTSVGGGSWGTERPALTFQTSTGKVRITVSASILSVSLSVTAAATFSIDGQIDRAANIAGITSGTFVGAVNAFATDVIASGSYVHTVEGLPINTPLTARFECYANGGSIGYAHPKIIVETIP